VIKTLLTILATRQIIVVKQRAGMKPAKRGNVIKSRRNALKLGLGGTLLVASGRPAFAREKVVIYTGLSEADFNKTVHDEFTRQTGIDVEMLVIPAAGAQVARIRAEKARPRADVVVSQTIPFMQSMVKDGLLLPYKAKAETPEYLQKGYADPDGFWHGWFALTPALFWNTRRFEADPVLQGVKPPATWDDLLNPAFKGKVALPSPQTTAIGYVLLATQVFRLGEQNAWEYERKLNANISQWTASPQLMVTLVEQGEAAVGAGWSSDVLNSKVAHGQALNFVLPPQDAVIVHTAGIIKGGPNPDGAGKYIDFLQTDFAQAANAKMGFRAGLNPDVPPPQGAPPLTSLDTVKYDTDWATANYDRLPKQWARELGQ
jgi:iron(III) transport system substrate-binding protein